MIYGYARCSTNETKQDINRQIRELKALGVSKENIFKEYESGTKEDRTELNRLLSLINKGDTVVATEVSRITRSTKQLISLIEFVRDNKLKLILGSMVIDCTKSDIDPMTKAMLQMMGVFAELERNMISERVKSGMANAKAKGSEIGRPKTSLGTIPSKFLKNYDIYRNGDINISELAKLCDMSRTTVYKYISIIEG